MTKPAWNKRRGQARRTKHYRARIEDIARDVAAKPTATEQPRRGAGDDEQRQRSVDARRGWGV